MVICQVKKSFKKFLYYGGEGIRTPDPRLAKPMLSQLSYTPYLVISWRSSVIRH